MPSVLAPTAPLTRPVPAVEPTAPSFDPPIVDLVLPAQPGIWRRPAPEPLLPVQQGRLPMQHAAWISSGTSTLVPRDQIVWISAGDAPPHRALAPMLLRPDALWPVLELIGHADTGEPGDLLWDNPDALNALVEQLAAQPLPLRLDRVPADSPTLPALRRAFRRRGVLLERPAPGLPTLPLDPGWLQPQAQFNAGRRSDFRRAERQAAARGPVSFEMHEALEGARLDRLLDEAYAVEDHGWKKAQRSALALDTRMGAFFRRFAHAAARAGLLRLAFMRIGERAVGMQIAVEWDQRYWLLKIGFDTDYARCSPGQLLMRHTVQYSAERHLKSYEFLGRPAPWIDLWTRTQRPCVSVRAYPYSLAGLGRLGHDLAHTLRQRLTATTES